MMREIVFFDVETTAPSPAGRWWLLEFGAIVVCPRKLVEVRSYDTLIRPGDPSAVSRRFCAEEIDLEAAPAFEEVADSIFEVLHGRVWAGHNIQRFDCPRIREAFADIGRPAPEPAGVIDSLNVLAHDFGRRAGDLKMATLATYFGIGKQKHRSLDDARMNLEVLKHCATVLLLESTLPGLLHDAGAGAVTRRRTAAAEGRGFTTTPTATPAPRGKTKVVLIGRPSPRKRDSLGKLLPNKPAPPAAATSTTTNKQQQQQAGASAASPLLMSSAARVRRAATTTPFHMILRHSRAILR